jgi:hypothetical protein
MLNYITASTMMVLFFLIALILYGMRRVLLDLAFSHLPYTPIPGFPSLKQGESMRLLFTSGIPRDQAMERLERTCPEGMRLGLLQMPMLAKPMLNVMDLEHSKRVLADHRTQYRISLIYPI